MNISIAVRRTAACAALVLVSGSMMASAQSSGTAVLSPFPAYDKVVIVIEENQQFPTIIGNPVTPYTNWLANNGALLTESYGCEHPSQPNYLDLFSGSDQNTYGDSLITTNPFSEQNLGAQLLHAGLSFAGFSEDLPYVGDTVDQFAAAPGDPPGTEDYARKHNPWCNWQNDAFPASPTNTGSNYVPSTVNQPLTPFTTISAAQTFSDLPTVSIIVPNQQHDDHGISGGLSGNALYAAGDKWLKQNLHNYANWAKTHNSLLIVTWDEDDYSSINRVPTILFGAHIKTGTYSEPNLWSYTSLINADNMPSGAPEYEPVKGVNHWNILRTVESIYNLGGIGQADNAAAITDVFKP